MWSLSIGIQSPDSGDGMSRGRPRSTPPPRNPTQLRGRGCRPKFQRRARGHRAWPVPSDDGGSEGIAKSTTRQTGTELQDRPSSPYQVRSFACLGKTVRPLPARHGSSRQLALNYVDSSTDRCLSSSQGDQSLSDECMAVQRNLKIIVTKRVNSHVTFSTLKN